MVQDRRLAAVPYVAKCLSVVRNSGVSVAEKFVRLLISVRLP